MKNSTVSLCIAAILGSTAFANTTPEVLPKKQSQSQGQNQSSYQAQNQNQEARATALSESGAEASSSSGGNTLSTHYVSRESAAALAQGSLVLGECGFGANGGGSGRGGAGFLGIAFQTPQCNDFKLAGYYFTIGDYATGCAIIANTKAGKRQAKRGITLPQCKNPEPIAPTPPVVVNVEAPKTSCDVAFKQCVAK